MIHEKARLSILSSLASHADGLLFNDLKALCALTDGNLSRQLQVLQEAGFVEVWKGFRNKRPQTLCRLTPDGREPLRGLHQHSRERREGRGGAPREGRAGQRLAAPEGFMPA